MLQAYINGLLSGAVIGASFGTILGLLLYGLLSTGYTWWGRRRARSAQERTRISSKPNPSPVTENAL